MERIQHSLSCALIIVAFFTLDTKALSRVDPRGYRPANTSHTYTQQPQQQKWQAPQQLLPANYATQRSTMQAPQWNNGVAAVGGGGGGVNYNQWSTYNQSIGGLNNNKNQWNQYNQTATTNPWQRYNTTYGGGGNWNVQPQNRPFSNDSHLYPTLPGQVINGGHRPFQPVPTVNPRFNNQWNQSVMQPPYGVPSTNRSTNWWPSQNKTNNWGYVAPTTPQPYYRPPNSNNNGGIGNGQTNWWNHTKTNNNNAIGWGGSNPNAAGYPGQGGQASGQQQPNSANWGRQVNQTQPNSNNWRDANTATGLQPADNTNSGWGSANNWQAGGTNIGGQNPYNSNSNSNNPNAYGQNIGGSSSGTQLAPLGGDSGVQQPSNGGIPLAPIGGGNNAPAANSPFGWNSAGVKNPNSWNHGVNSGGSQLAPLAPLGYGGGRGGNTNNNINNGGSNPYANMFNK